MTNPILNNYIGNEQVILWQYDKAVNLISLIGKFNDFASASCEQFWNYFGNKMLAIDQADTYGLNVWGNLLGIPRPTIKIPKEGDGADDGPMEETEPDFSSVSSEDEAAIAEKESEGYKIYKTSDGITYLYKPKVIDDVEYDFYGYSPDGYKVVDDGIFYEGEGDNKVQRDSGYKIITIKNELFRGLLKGRFFLMCHTPTVPNYNRYLSIVFGSVKKNDTASPKKVYRDIFDWLGNLKSLDGGDSYLSRNIALDFQDMTMGFTFPKQATTEEAYLIFQHYDIVYPFPAGIRYPGEFLMDDLVIGLNTDQEASTEDNQNYRNFVDGMILAEDSKTGNQNGGIFSTTDRANYKVPSSASGIAYIYNADDLTAQVMMSFKSRDNNSRQAVWIDWGNGQCGYNYLPVGLPSDTHKTFSTTYKEKGLYPIVVLYDKEKVELWANTFRPEETYNLCGGGV